MQKLFQILDPISWMRLFTEAYSQNASPTHVWFLLSILLVHCLSRLFSEMLVGVFENTVRNMEEPPVQAKRLLLDSVHKCVDFSM